MTAKEIRDAMSANGLSIKGAFKQLPRDAMIPLALLEIAAQLAELNETLKTMAQPKVVHYGGDPIGGK